MLHIYFCCHMKHYLYLFLAYIHKSYVIVKGDIISNSLHINYQSDGVKISTERSITFVDYK